MYQEPHHSPYRPVYGAPPPSFNANKDVEHLNMLAIGHYVIGGLAMLFACLPILHLVIGLKIILSPPSDPSHGPSAEFGWFFVIFASVFILGGWSLGAATIYAGRQVAKRQKHTFCLIMAALNCFLFSPFGTVLGVFTFVVLLRESVKPLFNGGTPVYPVPPPPPGSIYR